MKAKLGMLLVAGLLMAAKPAKVTLCHFDTTMEVPEQSVAAHLAHGDYLGECASGEGIPEVVSSAYPLYNMWLLTKDFRVEHAKGTVTIVSSYWHCLIRSDGPPSVERQRALCFRGQYPEHAPDQLRHLADEDRRLNGWWVADNTPCAAPVMSDGTWACDALTRWRLK